MEAIETAETAERQELTSTALVTGAEQPSCIRCGLCLAVCPTYRVTLRETESPRGRVALLRALDEKKLDLGEGLAKRYYACMLCGACTAVCPSGVPLDGILQAARDDMHYHKLEPERLVQLGQTILKQHNISGEDNTNRLLWTANMDQAPAGVPAERSRATADVVYFVGCVGSFFPRSYRLPQTMAQLMDKAGLDYALLGGEERCCGYPMLISGELDRAGELIHHNLEAVKALQPQKVVFTCPSCLHIWDHVYREVAGGELPFRLMHATELLANMVDEGKLKFRQMPAQRVTYHDPCDLGRKEGIFEAPRRVLRAIPGLELVEMRDNRKDSHCCGGGGNLETFDAELSRAVSDRRLAQAREVEAEVVVSACQQCERTLTEAARRNRVRLRVADVAELALQALDEG